MKCFPLNISFALIKQRCDVTHGWIPNFQLSSRRRCLHKQCQARHHKPMLWPRAHLTTPPLPQPWTSKSSKEPDSNWLGLEADLFVFTFTKRETSFNFFSTKLPNMNSAFFLKSWPQLFPQKSLCKKKKKKITLQLHRFRMSYFSLASLVGVRVDPTPKGMPHFHF